MFLIRTPIVLSRRILENAEHDAIVGDIVVCTIKSSKVVFQVEKIYFPWFKIPLTV
jgi:hypothetical protein